MLFIIDLDYTLLNTSKLKKAMFKSVKNLGVDEKIWLQTYQMIVKNGNHNGYNYDIKKHSRLLAKKINGNAKLIENAQKKVLRNIPRFLYPDTIGFLEFLKKNNAAAVLLTLGNTKWQKQKIKNLGIKKYFYKLIFTPRHKKYLKLKFDHQPQNWIFINDNAKEINELKKISKKSIFLGIERKNANKIMQKESWAKIPKFSDLTGIKKYLLGKKLLRK